MTATARRRLPPFTPRAACSFAFSGQCVGRNLLLTVLLLELLSPVAFGDYPERPVQVVVPFNPGGESDTFTRLVQAAIDKADLMPVPLVVLNVGGAGGTIGSRRVKDAAADGYTLLNLHDGILSASLTGQADYGPEAFEPIAAVGRASSVVCVSENAAWNSLRELLDEAAAQPATIRFGANLGALSHFGALQLEQTTSGAKFRYVPTGGGAKRYGDLLGGHIDVTVFNAGEFDQFKAGGIRALAILSNERHPAFPDIPTAVEQGVNAVRDSMQYFWAPKGTPRRRIAWFQGVLKEALQTEFLQRRLAEMKVEPTFITGPELRRVLRQREQVMKGVRMTTEISLPNTPRLAGLVTAVLGIALLFKRRFGDRRDGQRNNQAPPQAPSGDVQTHSTQRAKPVGGETVLSLYRTWITLGLLIGFCVLFGFSVVPFWLLSPLFIVAMGLVLLPRDRRWAGWLVAVAVITGPGCYLLFTKVLTIDLP